MAYRDLTLAIADGVAVGTLDRPAQRNAVSGPMAVSLAAAYRACDGDDAVRAVVLIGAGSAFCVGADLGRSGALQADRWPTVVRYRNHGPPARLPPRSPPLAESPDPLERR